MSNILIDARESGTTSGRYIDKLMTNLEPLKTEHSFMVLTTEARQAFVKKQFPRSKVIVTKHKEFTFAEQLGLFKQIRDLKVDLVFFPMPQQPILYRGPVVTTINDLTTVRFRNPSKNWLVFTVKQWVFGLVLKYVARKSKALLTFTDFVKDDIARFARINSRKITVTHLAADAITDKPEPIEDLEGKRFIMYVGRPLPHKNLPRLIEAFAVLRQKYPDLHLVLAGKQDALYRRIAKDVRHQALGNVHFTGFITEGQLRWLYENTATYVFPSLSEGFGLPGLEAMMHGAPVASSNATCLPEVYQDAAVYFDPANPKDIADKISQILDDSKLAQQLVQKGKKQASKYSWQRMAEQTLTIFDDAVDAQH